MRSARAHILLEAKSPNEAEDAPTGPVPVRSRLPAGAVAFVHHIRNILSSVGSYAQLLLPRANGGETPEYLEIIEAASSGCCELIDRMLRPTTSRRAGDAGESDAGRVAKWACDLARGEATLRGIEIVLEADSRLPPAAIPREDLESVLLDLVRNAVQATRRPGRVEVRVRTCRLGRGTPGVEIEVADTGRGIPECARRKIFEPFFTTRGPGDGLGLGLALAVSLVKRSDGSIDLETAEGSGTTFSVRIPAA
ncbi:MAG: ATP-binding protein [Planctomycetota bacterium]|jgi:two-component system C4-dicarboxylate transport sensor histidine kinase DctB